MISSSRQPNSSFRKKGRGNVFIRLAVLLIVLFALILFLKNAGLSEKKGVTTNEDIVGLWNKMKYKELINKSAGILEDNPLNPTVLIYTGLANFYYGNTFYKYEEKIGFIDRAIVLLRKALLLKGRGRIPSKVKAQITNVLGKAYFYKGKFYMDLSILYIEKAIKDGYIDDSTYEHLGLAYKHIGRYDESIFYLKKISGEKRSDFILFELAKVYLKKKKIREAGKLLKEAEALSRNDIRLELIRIELGKLFILEKKFTEALDQFLLIVNKNSNSYYGYLYLGDVYKELSEDVKKRAAWKKAYRLNNSIEIRKRLYN